MPVTVYGKNFIWIAAYINPTSSGNRVIHPQGSDSRCTVPSIDLGALESLRAPPAYREGKQELLVVKRWGPLSSTGISGPAGSQTLAFYTQNLPPSELGTKSRSPSPQHHSKLPDNEFNNRFFALPRELRDRIYQFLVVQPETIVPFSVHHQPIKVQAIESKNNEGKDTPPTSQPAVTRVNRRQLRREALQIYYKENSFHLDISNFAPLRTFHKWRITIRPEHLVNLRYISVPLCIVRPFNSFEFERLDNVQHSVQLVRNRTAFLVRGRFHQTALGQNQLADYFEAADALSLKRLHDGKLTGIDLMNFIIQLFWSPLGCTTGPVQMPELMEVFNTQETEAELGVLASSGVFESTERMRVLMANTGRRW
ncbi:hypothetical protein M501DRAFT_992832 [Patellaria atrata CBS 101060]|uniref:Uncharacterized protein n=1 Tax=Patellaria atrata CBS 101060 TaxID=1346257 RepID=A0A9P4VPK4_9PEZI|nr:hypothetical protein M501DRAFT_992832 [Patellaria atrata CBS 101060]